MFDAIDGFDESFQRHQDYEFLIRLAKRGKIAYIDEPLVRKYESDSPTPETVKLAKRKYITKFRDEIESIEDQKPQTSAIHRHNLGQLYLKHGYLLHAIEYIDRTQLQLPTDLIPLAWKYLTGVTDRISRKFLISH